MKKLQSLTYVSVILLLVGCTKEPMEPRVTEPNLEEGFSGQSSAVTGSYKEIIDAGAPQFVRPENLNRQSLIPQPSNPSPAGTKEETIQTTYCELWASNTCTNITKPYSAPTIRVAGASWTYPWLINSMDVYSEISWRPNCMGSWSFLTDGYSLGYCAEVVLVGPADISRTSSWGARNRTFHSWSGYSPPCDPYFNCGEGTWFFEIYNYACALSMVNSPQPS